MSALPPLQAQPKGVALSVLRQMVLSLADDALSSSEVPPGAWKGGGGYGG